MNLQRPYFLRDWLACRRRGTRDTTPTCLDVILTWRDVTVQLLLFVFCFNLPKWRETFRFSASAPKQNGGSLSNLSFLLARWRYVVPCNVYARANDANHPSTYSKSEKWRCRRAFPRVRDHTKPYAREQDAFESLDETFRRRCRLSKPMVR